MVRDPVSVNVYMSHWTMVTLVARYWETGGDLNENGDKGKMWTSYLVDQIAQAAPNTERNGR